MTKREELSKIVSEWSDTHPNRKDQPTLYFVIDRLLQNIVDSLEFDVFEENAQVLKFKCSNFPINGKLEIKKKTNNLFLLLDLNPYSLVIDNEKRSKEYIFTAFIDDYKYRVAEFVFLNYKELATQLASLHDSYLSFTLSSLYTREISTQFVLSFNELYNKYENVLNKIHAYHNSIIGTDFLNNSVYGLYDIYKCVPRLLYKYTDTSEASDEKQHSLIELDMDVVPVINKLENKKCFDAIFSFVKENMEDQYREYDLLDLTNRKACLYKKDSQNEAVLDTLILNKNTFNFLFPESLFPEWCLIWGACSIYITEDISDGSVLFIRSRDNVGSMRNAICIDRENKRYYVNRTSKSILAFHIPVKTYDNLVSETDQISTNSIMNVPMWIGNKEITEKDKAECILHDCVLDFLKVLKFSYYQNYWSLSLLTKIDPCFKGSVEQYVSSRANKHSGCTIKCGNTKVDVDIVLKSFTILGEGDEREVSLDYTVLKQSNYSSTGGEYSLSNPNVDLAV